MKLSIIIPVYNVETYVRECLDSVSELQNLDYEIIVVNDGSTDSSLQVVEDFWMNFEGDMKIISKKNGGLSSARNCGIQSSCGDYICFLDSDDFVVPQKFVNLVHSVMEDQVEVGFGNLVRYNEKEEYSDDPSTEWKNKVFGAQSPILSGVEFAERIFDRKKDFINVEACIQIISRKFLMEHQISFKEGIYHEDTLFTYQEFMTAKKMKYYNIPFYVYRYRSDSIMNSSNQKTIDKKLLDKYNLAYEFYNLKNKYGISAYFIDSMIIEFIFFVCVRNKKKYDVDKKMISECKKKTNMAKLKRALICFR